MANKPALCALAPRHVSRSRLTAETTRRFLRERVHLPLSNPGGVGRFELWDAYLSNIFSDHEVVFVFFGCEKANTKHRYNL